MTTARIRQGPGEERLNKLREQIGKKHGKAVQQLYDEREKRVKDAIELREPDRVPVVIGGSVFAARYHGVPLSAAYYDVSAYKEAIIKMLVEFEPDQQREGVPGASAGGGLEVLDAKQTRWPGGNLPPNVSHQYVEGEYMKANEYDLFLSDPSDFVLRYYLPRVFGILSPLTRMPALRTLISGSAFSAVSSIFATPEYVKLGEALRKTGQEQEKWRLALGDLEGELSFLGFPPSTHGGGAGGAPFDVISDRLRGMRGAMLDMYRCPDKLLAACEKLLEWQTARATPADPRRRGNPKITGGALHRGSDGFMSLKQFETFYWPGLKKVIEVSVNLGYIYRPFCEGVWDDRLEYLLELPKGKVIFNCEKTDVFRAKEVLRGHMCIQGGVPGTLLEVGSPQEVEEHCKKLIKIVGKDGGFILSPGVFPVQDAKPENIRAMVDSVKKYGWY